MRNPVSIKVLIGPGAFRLFLAMMVFIHHATRLALGKAAVEIFFCLSGFWIYRMWSNRYVKADNPIFTYMVSRAWRLIPTFALIAVITLAYQHYGLGSSWAALKGAASWPHFVLSHLVIFGYNNLPVQPLRPAWSLDVEMQFYLIAPLLIVLTQRVGAAALLTGAAAVSLASVLAFGPQARFDFLICFAVGIAAAHVDWRPSGRTAGVAGAALALLLLGVLASPWRGMLLGGAHPGPLFRYSEGLNALVALLAVPYAIFTTRQRGGAGDSACGDLSYIVYLLHWTAIGWLATLSGLPGSARLGLLGLAMAATLAAAWGIWKYYDKPLNRLRARWVEARGRTRASAAGAEPAGP